PAALVLRLVHGEVRLRQNRVLVGHVGRAYGDAHAGGDMDLVAFYAEGRAQDVDELRRQNCRISGVAKPGLNDGELVAAETRDRVDLPQALLEPLCDRHEQLVSHLVAERVVDVLELIEVEKEDRKTVVASLHPADLLLEALAEHHSVRQVGQEIMAGRVYGHLLGTLALDDFLLEVGGEDLQAVSAVAAAHQISNQQRRE